MGKEEVFVLSTGSVESVDDSPGEDVDWDGCVGCSVKTGVSIFAKLLLVG